MAWSMSLSGEQTFYNTGGGANEYLGRAIALSHDGAIAVSDVWTSTNVGAIKIYRKTAGTWALAQTFAPADVASGDYFGWDVSISSDGSYIAATSYSPSTNKGSCYILYNATPGSGTWSQQQKLTGYTYWANWNYAGKVCLSADGAFVAYGEWGADGLSGYYQTSGCIRSFTRSGTNWTEVGIDWATKENAVDDQQTDARLGRYGCKHVDGLYGLFSAQEWDEPGKADAGKVYFWNRPNLSGSWTGGTSGGRFHQAWTGTPIAGGWLGLGSAIARNGLKLAFSERTTVSGYANCGSLFVKSRALVTDQFAAFQQLTPSDPAANLYYADGSVAISSDGKVIVVGANNHPGAVASGGRLYFYGLDTGGTYTEYLTSYHSAPQSGAQFGATVALSNDATTLMVGMQGWDNGGTANVGAVVFYTLTASESTARNHLHYKKMRRNYGA